MSSRIPDSTDYIVVGGGTAGMVLASRLSEDPNIHVAVLEAGQDLLDDPRVQIPAMWTSMLGSEVDWAFNSVPQVRLLSRHASKLR